MSNDDSLEQKSPLKDVPSFASGSAAPMAEREMSIAEVEHELVRMGLEVPSYKAIGKILTKLAIMAVERDAALAGAAEMRERSCDTCQHYRVCENCAPSNHNPEYLPMSHPGQALLDRLAKSEAENVRLAGIVVELLNLAECMYDAIEDEGPTAGERHGFEVTLSKLQKAAESAKGNR